MSHVMYVLFNIGFALNVASCIMAFIVHRQRRDQQYRYLFLLVACELAMYCLYYMSVYLVMINIPVDFIGEFIWHLINYAAGAALFYFIQRSFYRLLSVRFTLKKRIVHLAVAFSMLIVYLGLVVAFGPRWKMYCPILYHLTTLQFAVVVYLLVRYRGRIAHRELKNTMRIWLIIICVIVPGKLVAENDQASIALFDSLFGIRWPFLCLLLVSTNIVMFRFLIIELITPMPTADPVVDRSLFTAYDLTEREIEVAELLIDRRSYREIGERLFISIPTVKTHVNHIYQKMNIGTRGELLELAAGLKK